MRAIAVLGLAAAAGCTPLTSDFACTVDADCESASGQAGRCEPTRRCSLPDPACASGSRYGSYAGELSGRCTSLDDCVSEVRAGDRATCVRRGDEVWCWGDGNAIPARRELSPGQLAEIDVGGTGQCARYAAGQVECWTGPVTGQIAGLSSQDLAIGRDHACAVSDGRVACWGSNDHGQLGDGTMTARTAPVFVGGLTDVRQVAAGDDTSCAVTAAGAVWCWGDDSDDQLGRGFDFSMYSLVPVMVTGLSSVTVKSVAVGKRFACAATTTGAVYCWGLNDHGQLGYSTLLDTSDTAQQVVQVSGVDQISAGGSHACALGRDAVLRCWGANDSYQCAGPSTANVTTASVVVDAAGAPLKLTAVETGDKHTCGRGATDGALYCWGANAAGQLGTGGFDTATRPVTTKLECR
jgi:alpha-tubulin suppressor-like RCC1 family protein